MTTRVMDMDGCDMAHEALLLREFGEGSVESTGTPARGRRRRLKVASRSGPEEMFEGVICFISSALPKCP